MRLFSGIWIYSLCVDVFFSGEWRFTNFGQYTMAYYKGTDAYIFGVIGLIIGSYLLISYYKKNKANIIKFHKKKKLTIPFLIIWGIFIFLFALKEALVTPYYLKISIIIIANISMVYAKVLPDVILLKLHLY